MDRRSRLWRRKSSEKSPGETESSGSVSSFSERFSNDQEASRASPVSASPNNVQPPTVSSKITDQEVHQTVKTLNEKLSDALISISAKEDLVKQHAKVAEEAVAGWENAEKEVAALKQKLEVAYQKNSALNERIDHLDGALKECARQLSHSREDQQKKLHEAVIQKTTEWESEKTDFESRLSELQSQLEFHVEASFSYNHDLQLKLQAIERENSTLKDELQMKTLERELSTRTAETISKQHLDSIRKVAKLEAECRRIQASAKKSSSYNDQKLLHSSSAAIESIADSQSETGSVSWASALISELDQFKNDKVTTKSLTSPIEVDLMDDFLEMEKLAALPEVDRTSSSFEIGAKNPSRVDVEHEALQWRIVELEEKVGKITTEKREVEVVLAETRNQLKISCEQLVVAESTLIKLQRQLNSTNGLKHFLEKEVEAVDLRKKEVESQLQSSNLEVKKLIEKVRLLEGTSTNLATKCRKMEGLVAKKEELEGQLNLAYLEVKKLTEKVGVLEVKVKEERSLCTKLAAKCQNMEAIESEKMGLESKFISAQVDAKEIQAKLHSLEAELEEEREMSKRFIAKVEELSSELDSTRMEVEKLREVDMKLFSELADKDRNLEDVDKKREELETQLRSSQVQVVELGKKVSLLEGTIEEQRPLKSQLELASAEVRRLYEKVKLLEKEVDEEKTLSAKFAAKCQNLNDELVKNKWEDELQLPASSTIEPKIRKEKEIALAAEKFAECQKTIASLNQRLKLMADFDVLMLESSSLPNSQEMSFPQYSSPSSLHIFGTFVSPSMSYTNIESQ